MQQARQSTINRKEMEVKRQKKTIRLTYVMAWLKPLEQNR